MTPSEYISNIEAPERRAAFERLRAVVLENIPEGFEECISYGMIGYVVPHRLYAPGYHCDPKLPLPFVSIAAQKNFFALYHMGVYVVPALHDWFVAEYPQHAKGKLDMGKSCIRFKKTDDIPYDLIAQLLQKMTVEDWVGVYESEIKK